MIEQRRLLLASAALTAALAGLPAAQAQPADWPTRPIRLVVPFAAGGTTDLIARVVAEPLGRELGQPVIVENRGGGGGTIGAAEIVRAAPDGYAIGISTISTIATNPAINPKTPYDPLTDFTPIVNLAATPSVIAVNKDFAGKDLKSAIETLKRAPDKYSYGSSGQGGIQHLMMEMFKIETGTSITHIPYRGAGPALADTVAGQVAMTLDQIPSILPFIKSGQLVPLVVAAPQRVPVLPDVPTLAEAGMPGVNRLAFYGVVGPKGMPPAVVQRLNAAAVKVLNDPAVRKRIEDTGSFVVANSPEAFGQQIREEYRVYKDVVTRTRLTLD
ncbi:putattive exported protein [Bordetella ansorpii]|uniref:Putattive exported protein n=1 Tax=Bordetella ansorpii TaxID=288768 RepID=A0A157P9P4_9BORD|nr:tripartite tricarboxylate transporter substrate binding protein BugE [Bordetella ansorpii]SAI30020.1 putattive exported protein [Bordetella ansorpii]